MSRVRVLPPLVVLLYALCGTPWAVAEDAPAPSQAPIEATPIERPPVPSRSDSIAADLVRQVPAAEFVSLKEGEHDFAALWRPANVGEPKGVIILLPGEGESADWPRGIGPLRRGLPDHGWHTLSLSLPDAPGQVQPNTNADESAELPVEEAEATAEQPADVPPPSEAGYLPEEASAAPGEPGESDPEAQAPNDAEPPLPMHAERIAERIEAALAFARSKQPSSIVLLGQGTGGYWAARYLQQLAPSDVSRLVMIQPRQPEEKDEPLAQLVSTLKLATGDFYYGEGHGNRTAARERLNASRRIQHPAYHQVGLPSQTGDRQVDQEHLVRRVRGWLDKQT